MGDQREIYQGYALQAIDRKGRVAIPAGLRDTLLLNTPERVLAIGDEAELPCMTAYDRPWARLLKARLEADYTVARERGEGIKRAHDALLSFGNVDAVAFDDAGRFIMPAFAIEVLDLADYVFFVGAGDVLQLWNPRTLIDADGVPEGTRKRCAFEMKARKVAA